MARSLRPLMPPAALISSTAIWAPFFMYGPMAAEEPLRGVSMPSLMSPPAEPESELDEESERPPPQAASPRVSVAAARRVPPRRIGLVMTSYFLANTVAIVLHPGRMSRAVHTAVPTRHCVTLHQTLGSGAGPVTRCGAVVTGP